MAAVPDMSEDSNWYEVPILSTHKSTPFFLAIIEITLKIQMPVTIKVKKIITVFFPMFLPVTLQTNKHCWKGSFVVFGFNA